MCGIVGYVGSKNSVVTLLDGLKRLEYRGYDSAGIAIVRNSALLCVKEKGKVACLEEKITREWSDWMEMTGCTGIAPVSYTHLTLPTKRIVQISVVSGSFKKKNNKEN
eukprot:TRINITY_DN1511_c0_g1_i1.p5 TRINITY_DN1511_c0_g1~~TRINITY_DN1511_c0_g1_i1.p5  ORF type:complete len:108 (+),score=17.49 TRINITY_DN1511_c0_g1_i1:1221-1544(+)